MKLLEHICPATTDLGRALYSVSLCSSASCPSYQCTTAIDHPDCCRVTDDTEWRRLGEHRYQRTRSRDDICPTMNRRALQRTSQKQGKKCDPFSTNSNHAYLRRTRSMHLRRNRQVTTAENLQPVEAVQYPRNVAIGAVWVDRNTPRLTI